MLFLPQVNVSPGDLVFSVRKYSSLEFRYSRSFFRLFISSRTFFRPPGRLCREPEGEEGGAKIDRGEEGEVENFSLIPQNYS